MRKTNFFDLLDALATTMHKSVSLAVARTAAKEDDSLCNEADRLQCDCEHALFLDFLPPLERHSIAMLAQALANVVHHAEVLRRTAPLSDSGGKHQEANSVLLILSEQLVRDVALLRIVRKPQAMPDLYAYRKELIRAEELHSGLQKRLTMGVLPRSAEQTVFALISLRNALATAFDTLVEVMLMNL